MRKDLYFENGSFELDQNLPGKRLSMPYSSLLGDPTFKLIPRITNLDNMKSDFIVNDDKEYFKINAIKMDIENIPKDMKNMIEEHDDNDYFILGKTNSYFIINSYKERPYYDKSFGSVN